MIALFGVGSLAVAFGFPVIHIIMSVGLVSFLLGDFFFFPSLLNNRIATFVYFSSFYLNTVEC